MSSEDRRNLSINQKIEQEQWQTTRMKTNLRFFPLKPGDHFLPLNPMEVEDTTTDPVEAQLALEFSPDVKLTGVGLFREKQTSWGGVYYRVLKNLKNDTERCIQWLYVWTKQAAFFTPWLILVAWCLGLLGLAIYNNLADQLGLALVFLGFLGGLLTIIGFLPLAFVIRKRTFYFNDTMLLIPLGLMFGLFWFELKTYPTRAFFLGTSYKLSLFALVYLAFGSILAVIWYFRGKMHFMDWAPLFIYIRKPQGDQWELQKVIYDAFHYYTEIKTKAELQVATSLGEGKNVKLDIPNSWHSFQLRKKIPTATLAMVVLGIPLLILIVLLVDWQASITANNFVLALTLALIVEIGYFSQPTDVLPPDLNLQDPKYHLTETKLEIFWTIYEEAALQIREKLQNPFIADKDFESFRDTH
ncbi:MAG: hypothetical protein ACFFCQ_16155 [Promethearchaeota archaeon]